MGKTALNSKNFGYQPETAATATRHIADKARFGVLYYLFSLVGIFSIAPNLQFQSLQFVLLLIALLLLSALREFVYRLSHNEDKPITRAQHYLQASYLLNGIVWSILSFIVFKSERALSGTAAATLITSVGLTAGGVTAIVPHFALIQRYSLLMMGTTGVMLPLLIADIATWYIAPLCFLYVFFLLGMGKRQCNIYWQLIESNQTLHRQTERLAAAQVEAVAGARAKTEFLANMSHEIRTPMNGVIGVAELLEKTPLNDQQKDYLKIIREAGTTLLTIIDDVLDFSKLEAKKMSLSEEPVDLDALVRNLQALFSLQLQNTDVHLRYERCDNLPAWVLADPARVRQLLYNLIGNAIKFTAAGSIVVKLECLPSETAAQALIRFSVTDTGIGIADIDRSHIFTKFGQIGTARSTTKSTGLGLAISKHLVELMGGTIDFDSEPGVGSRFWFELPLPVVSAPLNAAPQTNSAASTPLDGEVMVVEDNETNRIVAHGMLKHCGYNAKLVSSGAAAIAAVQQQSFGLILMDCDMPGIDGFTATQLIRDWETRERKPRTPIVALTAHVLESARQRCRDAGMDDYLAKPLSLGELESVLQRWMSGSSGAYAAPDESA